LPNRACPGESDLPIKEAFDRYVTLTDARNAEELRQGTPFLWVETHCLKRVAWNLIAPMQREKW